MKRIFVVLATLVAIFAFMAPASANNPVPTGGSSNGTYYDSDFLPASDYVYTEWTRASQSGSGRGELGFVVSPNALADWQGHKTCIMGAVDWVTPQQSLGQHYDYREVKNCDSNSSYSVTFIEPDNTCLSVVYYACDVPAKRVMIARYSPFYNTIISSECRDFGTGKCSGWSPTCAGTDNTPVTCTVWVKHEDGSIDKYGNTDAEHSTSNDV